MDDYKLLYKLICAVCGSKENVKFVEAANCTLCEKCNRVLLNNKL